MERLKRAMQAAGWLEVRRLVVRSQLVSCKEWTR